MVARSWTKDYQRELQLATEGLSEEAIARDLAALAKTSLAEVIQSGEGSSRYDRFVNGRLDVPEEQVRPPGPILYQFHWWNEIIEETLKFLFERAPVKTGRYRESFVVMVNGSRVEDVSAITVSSSVLVVNTQPYARKIEVGHMRMSVPDGVVEDGVRHVRRRFGNVVEAKGTMVPLPGGYILKGVFTKGYKEFARTKLRKDTMAGAMMTYPGIVLNMRV